MIYLVNPLHYALHHNVKWSLATRFPFAARQLSAPVARSELAGMADQAPILIQQSGTHYVPVVLLKAEWCRAPLFDESMRWLGPQPPLALRYHPFRTLDDAARPGASVLGVANDPDCVGQEQANAFFDELARPLPLVRAVLRRLQRIQYERAQLVAAAAALQKAGLLSPLPLADARGRRLFHSIDATKFRALSGSALAELGAQPQHAWMLAAALEHSRSRHLVDSLLEPTAANEASQTAPAQRPQPRGPAGFLVDDDFTMSFEP
jgi:SapC